MSHTVIAYASVAVMAIVFTVVLMMVMKAWAAVAAISATLTASAYQLYVYLKLGYYDPFAPVAFVTSWLFAFVIAAAAAIVTRKLRQETRPKEPNGKT